MQQDHLEPYEEAARRSIRQIEEETGLVGILHEVRPGTGGPRLVLRLAAPGEHHFRVVNRIGSSLA
jgi:hypothetical protein